MPTPMHIRTAVKVAVQKAGQVFPARALTCSAAEQTGKSKHCRPGTWGASVPSFAPAHTAIQPQSRTIVSSPPSQGPKVEGLKGTDEETKRAYEGQKIPEDSFRGSRLDQSLDKASSRVTGDQGANIHGTADPMSEGGDRRHAEDTLHGNIHEPPRAGEPDRRNVAEQDEKGEEPWERLGEASEAVKNSKGSKNS